MNDRKMAWEAELVLASLRIKSSKLLKNTCGIMSTEHLCLIFVGTSVLCPLLPLTKSVVPH